MVDNLLLCIGCGKFRLSHGQRVISAGDKGTGDCLLLRPRHRNRRSLSPLLFGWLIGSGSSWMVSIGYAISALLLLAAAIAEWKLGVDAEGKSLENIASPLSSSRCSR